MSQPVIGIQLDLKGILFRPDYAPTLLSDLAAQGINAVLVEYEDVFPFDDLQIAFDRETRWTADQLRAFLAAAAAVGIEVIPLQQCLGHLEYLFRWRQYCDYAEDKSYPSTLALDSDEGKQLIRTMLQQILMAHPESQYIHLGMDEAHGLLQAAERTGQSVLRLFVDWLLELIDIVEAAGKTPLIWSDMLEDHFEAGLLDQLRDRVVLCPWDYSSQPGLSPQARIRGWRVSREWLNCPENPDAPAIRTGSRFLEDLPRDAAVQVGPYRHGRLTDAFFQVHMWTRLGFRVIGATAIRSSSHLNIMPRYLPLHGNISGFAQAIGDNQQLGLIGTSWARGNTFCPPNFPIELCWPSIRLLARTMGAAPPQFFPGIPEGELDRIIGSISRCREDWAIEKELIEQMTGLTPSLQAHHYEWACMILMLRVLQLHKRVDYAKLEVSTFRPSYRPVTPEWQRRLDDQAALRRELHELHAEVEAHFAERNHGEHFREWLRALFVVPAEDLDQCTAICREKQQQARTRYGW